MSLLKRLKEHFLEHPDDDLARGLIEQSNLVADFNSLRANRGWQTLESQMKVELHQILSDATNNNERAKVILDILQTVHTKDKAEILDQQIASFIGD